MLMCGMLSRLSCWLEPSHITCVFDVLSRSLLAFKFSCRRRADKQQIYRPGERLDRLASWCRFDRRRRTDVGRSGDVRPCSPVWPWIERRAKVRVNSSSSRPTSHIRCGQVEVREDTLGISDAKKLWWKWLMTQILVWTMSWHAIRKCTDDKLCL